MSFKDYDDLSETYDSRYKSEMSIKENEAIKILISKFIYPTSRVIDVGCGTGFALDINKSMKNYNYFGIDVSSKMILKAKEKYPNYAFVKYDINRDPLFTVRDFDIALSLFSVPYIGIGSIKNIKNVLKDGGVYIVVYYNKPYLNHDSVYYRHRLKYLLTVKPHVKKYMKHLKSEMKLMHEGYLTDDKTYCYALFKEYKK